MSEQKKTRAKLACDFCKKRKVKCDRENYNPCSQCKKKAIDCQLTTPTKKRGRKPGNTLQTTMKRLKPEDLSLNRHHHHNHNHLNNNNHHHFHHHNHHLARVPDVCGSSSPLYPYIDNYYNLVGACYIIFNRNINPQWSFFKMNSDEHTLNMIWKHFQDGIVNIRNLNWYSLVNYFKHALFFSTSSYALGLPCEIFNGFMKHIYQFYFQNNLQKIPQELLSDTCSCLFIFNIYEWIRTNASGQFKLPSALIQYAMNNSSLIDPKLYLRIKTKLDMEKMDPLLAFDQNTKYAEKYNMSEPATNYIVVMTFMNRILGYQPHKGWNLESPIRQDYFNAVNIFANRIENQINGSEASEFNKMIHMYLFILKAALWIKNGNYPEARIWAVKAVKKRYETNIIGLGYRGHYGFAGLHILHTRLLDAISSILGNPDLIDASTIIENQFNQPPYSPPDLNHSNTNNIGPNQEEVLNPVITPSEPLPPMQYSNSSPSDNPLYYSSDSSSLQDFYSTVAEFRAEESKFWTKADNSFMSKEPIIEPDYEPYGWVPEPFNTSSL